jgi:hypothetical protein
MARARKLKLHHVERVRVVKPADSKAQRDAFYEGTAAISRRARKGAGA